MTSDTQQTTIAMNEWPQRQDELAVAAGLAILIVDGKQPPALATSNNNSICQVIQSSPTYAHLCEPYCGRAFENAVRAGEPVRYRCHAGLYCVAAPLEAETRRQIVTIIGRSFSRAADYRSLTERIYAGGYHDLPDNELFQNVLIDSVPQELENLLQKLQNLNEIEKQQLIEFVAGTKPNPYGVSMRVQTQMTKAESLSAVIAPEIGQEVGISPQSNGAIDLRAKPGRIFGAGLEPYWNGVSGARVNQTTEQTALPVANNNQAITGAAQPLPVVTAGVVEQSVEDGQGSFNRLRASEPTKGEADKKTGTTNRGTFSTLETGASGIEDAAVQNLVRGFFQQSYREACVSALRLIAERYNLTALAWLERWQNWLHAALATGELQQKSPLRIGLEITDGRLRQAARRTTSLRLEKKHSDGVRFIELFPLTLGEEVRAAVVIGNAISEVVRGQIAEFCHEIAVPLEVLRLREELEREVRLSNAVQRFNEQLKRVDADELYDLLTQTSAELLGAERSSLLLYDEEEGTLKVKSATGERAEAIKQAGPMLGDRVANWVWENGQPVVVPDAEAAGLAPAPAERGYKSNSFLSFPLVIGGRKVGVLNVTEKSDGTAYDETDLHLLESVAPQLAIALDRAHLERKAGEFELMSITDPLTGLLNRRYLEERLTEELKRSQRHGYPMSFMMIDVDNFKQYNDQFHHQAGDEALQIVARCLRASLRSADVAARYGGEEFSILLPQTTLTEAELIAERIRQRIESTHFPHRRVTVSIGIAPYAHPQFDNPASVIAAADAALYCAKHEGRNAVRSATVKMPEAKS